LSQNPVLYSKANVTIHSNVVPTQAYLARLEGTRATCVEHQCCGGFFPTSILREIREHGSSLDSGTLARHCEDCALAEELKRRTIRLSAAEPARFWSLEEGDAKLVEDLGKGSDGTVSRILWRQGVFARKRFKRQVPYQNVNFSRELDVALEVSHPNIVHFFGCSSPGSRNSSGDCDLFMELLNTDLGRFIVEGARLHEGSGSPFQPFSFHDSLDVLLQVAEAMKHLHGKKFLHGDLKPQNILMDCLALTHSNAQYYLVKVADFGCAQRVDSSGSTVKPFRSEIGTLRYTAPEVLRCRKYRGALPEHPQKIDVYSFGVVAYQVLTGVSNLYEGLRNSEIIEGVIQGQLRPDYNFNRALDDNRSLLLPIIKCCWTALPQDRPSFSQVCFKIQALLST
jgi:serine/threonine protein kinase